MHPVQESEETCEELLGAVTTGRGVSGCSRLLPRSIGRSGVSRWGREIHTVSPASLHERHLGQLLSQIRIFLPEVPQQSARFGQDITSRSRIVVVQLLDDIAELVEVFPFPPAELPLHHGLGMSSVISLGLVPVARSTSAERARVRHHRVVY